MKQDSSTLAVGLNVLILGMNSWPQTPPDTQFLLPLELRPLCDAFESFYHNKHSGRKLTWLWQHSRNDIQTAYLKEKYIISASTYQTAVLLQYNKQITLSLDELESATLLSTHVLKQVLETLTRSRVLIEDIDDQYHLNLSEFIINSYSKSITTDAWMIC